MTIDFVIDNLLQLAGTFVVGVLCGYGIAKRPAKFPKPRRRIQGTSRCGECGAFHEYRESCPLVAGGVRRIQ